MSTLLHPGRRMTSAGLIVGLLGAALAALALVEGAPGPPAARSPGSPARSTPVARPTSESARAGLRLLSLAAAAGAALPYAGEQLVAWWGPAGARTSVIRVWHPPRGSVLAHVTNMGSTPSGASSAVMSPGQQDPDGVLGLSAKMLTLIRAHYLVSAAGQDQTDGRTSRIVELRRTDGSLAARFWLDSATGLLLRREMFDTRARMIGEDAFIDLQIGTGSLRDMPVPAFQAWSGQLGRAQLDQLRADGWTVPGTLPDGLLLTGAHQSTTTAGTVVDLDYSDGLSVVSVFVQRGDLPDVMPGWHVIKLNGRDVYSSDPDRQSLAWSAHGYVYTVIAAAPASTVGEMVAAMPYDAKPGFWHRISRGMRKLASWANPFR